MKRILCKIKILKIKIQTVFLLGLGNIARIFWYKLSVKIALNPVRRLSVPNQISPPFFLSPQKKNNESLEYNPQWLGQQTYFHWYCIKKTDFPNWHENVLTKRVSRSNHLPWWKISDFNSDLGDIKGLWEASRFDWAVCFAQQIVLGEDQYLEKLNQWLDDWVQQNPPYMGENWKCGQEASIRVMHLAVAALLLQQVQRSLPALLQLIEVHLQRIYPTMMYAIAQDNNHGTSEAAALYIGGSWLMFNQNSRGRFWYKAGEKRIKNRIQKLILEDGSFSQHSTNYHRLLLDTCSIVEIWRKNFNLPNLGDDFLCRVQAAVKWLFFMICKNGEVPNIGANDGAYLLRLGSEDYRDYRPSVQLASVLFCNKCAWDGGCFYASALHWLNIELPTSTLSLPTEVQTFDDGGYHLLRKNESFVVLRYPRFRFRPSHSDILHLDFWRGGKNIFRDSGTFSYNHKDLNTNLDSVVAHNTVQFDGREQMLKLGRFLWGAWPKGKDVFASVEKENLFCSAGYTDYQGASHYREVLLSEEYLRVTDKLKGVARVAILRWHLYPVKWEVLGNQVKSSVGSISFSATTSFNISLSFAFESCYYYKKTEVPVLEVVVHEDCNITTLYRCF